MTIVPVVKTQPLILPTIAIILDPGVSSISYISLREMITLSASHVGHRIAAAAHLHFQSGEC